MCARRYWDNDNNPLGDMTLDFFEKNILAHLKPFQNVNLQCTGESLLHKEFLSMLKFCKSLGCWTTFTTNGVILKKYANDVVSIGVDKITISIDGTKAMEKIRNVRLEKIIESIDAVNESKKRLNRSAPVIEVNCVLTRDNLLELPELIEIVGRHGVTAVTVIHIVIHDLALADQSVIPLYPHAEKYFDMAKAIADQNGIRLQLPPSPGAKNKCYQPFHTVVINWNGDVRPCCISTINEKGALLVGNLSDSSLSELWNNKYMHNLRKSLVKEQGMHEICEHCCTRSCDLESHTHILK
jgi:radical SAM protein with 4Fe4S-binding SPASM domain